LRRYRSLAVLLFLAGCAQQPGEPGVAGSDGGGDPLARLPATFENVPSCPACLRVTLTLRLGGSYAVRERLASSEFYDFGRWELSRAEGLLSLEGGRFDARRYLLRSPDTLAAQQGVQGGDLKRRPEVEKLRGPFRLTGLYDGATFKDCSTGLVWPVDDSQAGGGLKREYLKTEAGMAGKPALVSIDARFDEEGTAREEVHIQRIPAILSGAACPGSRVN
jgi:NlpE C-terminal OB domain